jgi:hypothetical protein
MLTLFYSLLYVPFAQVHVWDSATGKSVRVYSGVGITGPVNGLAFHPHDHIIAMSSFGYSQPLVFMCSDPTDTGSAVGWAGAMQPYESPLHRGAIVTTSRLPPFTATEPGGATNTYKASTAAFTDLSTSARLSTTPIRQQGADERTRASEAAGASGGSVAGAWASLRSTLRATQAEGLGTTQQRSRSPSPSAEPSVRINTTLNATAVLRCALARHIHHTHTHTQHTHTHTHTHNTHTHTHNTHTHTHNTHTHTHTHTHFAFSS